MGPAGASRNLFLATVAFAVVFVGWSLIAPLGKRFQDDLDDLEDEDELDEEEEILEDEDED